MFKDHKALFDEYSSMNVDYGIMIDHIRDVEATRARHW
jgi:hypothetical protein